MKRSRNAVREGRGRGSGRSGFRWVAGLAVIAIVTGACSRGTPKSGGAEQSKEAPTVTSPESTAPQVPATSTPEVIAPEGPTTSAPQVPATSAPGSTTPPTGGLPQGVRPYDITSESHDVHLFGLASGAGALWVPDEMGPWVYRVDADSGKVTDIALRPGAGPEDIADSRAIVAEGSVWVADGRPEGHVYRVDPETGKVQHTFKVFSPLGVSSGFGSIWVSSYEFDQVLRIDPETNKVAAVIDAFGPLSLVPSPEGMWVLEHSVNTVGLIDPKKNEIVRRIDFDAESERMEASMGSLWVSSPTTDEVLQLDPDAGKLRGRVAVDGHPYEMANGPGGLWISSENGLYRIGAGNELAGPIALEGSVGGVTIQDGQVWTTGLDGTRLFALDPSSL